MSATRTQIYLTEIQRHRLDELATAAGITMAEVVRRAIDAYTLEDIDPRQALCATFGADPAINVPDRAEWDRG